MKLKTGQTIRVGFAFLSICAFWQMYNSIIPLILTNTFAMNETISGAIMAADNVLAIFLLPLFGGISDRCKSKMGRRKPFLLYGTLVSVVLMLLLPILEPVRCCTICRDEGAVHCSIGMYPGIYGNVS